MPRILVYGSLNIDHVYRVPHFVRQKETLTSTGREIFPGGKGLNQAIAFARAGTASSIPLAAEVDAFLRERE